MPRVTTGPASRKRRKKWLKRAKGFVGGRNRLYRTARHSAERAMAYQYRDRRTKKRDLRRLWITRINAGARLNGMSYSRFAGALKIANVTIDRKMLSGLAVTEPEAFAAVVEVAKAATP